MTWDGRCGSTRPTTGHCANHHEDDDHPGLSQAVSGDHIPTARLLSLPQTRLTTLKGHSSALSLCIFWHNYQLLWSSFQEEAPSSSHGLREVPPSTGHRTLLSVSEQLESTGPATCASLMMPLLVQPGLSSLNSPATLGAPLPMSLEVQQPWPVNSSPPRLFPWCTPTILEGSAQPSPPERQNSEQANAEAQSSSGKPPLVSGGVSSLSSGLLQPLSSSCFSGGTVSLLRAGSVPPLFPFPRVRHTVGGQ